MLGESGNPLQPLLPRPVERLLRRNDLRAALQPGRRRSADTAHAAPAAMRRRHRNGAPEMSRARSLPGLALFHWARGHSAGRARRHCAANLPRQLLRSRLRFSSGLLVRRAAELARRHSLPALDVERQLRRRRAALRLLSAAHLDAGRGAGSRAAVEAGSDRAHLSAAGGNRPRRARAGAPGAARWPGNPGRMRRALLRLHAVHRVRAHCLWGTDRRLLDSVTASLRFARPQLRRGRSGGAPSTAPLPRWRWCWQAPGYPTFRLESWPAICSPGWR